MKYETLNQKNFMAKRSTKQKLMTMFNIVDYCTSQKGIVSC